MMKISMASDHGGFEQKELLKKNLEMLGYEIVDFGTYSAESMDYPDSIYPACKAIVNNEVDCGIILCGTGIGASIVANKVNGIRCALVNSVEVAQLTKEHNNSNVLALAGRTTDFDTNWQVVQKWLNTPFSEETKHQNRIDKISIIETKEEA